MMPPQSREETPMPAASDMKGRAALVTGVASGLGRATALALAAAGAGLCLVDLNAEGLEETRAAAVALGVRAEAFAADLARPPSCREAVERAVAAFGRLDALCNVAGLIYFANTPEMPQAQFETTLAVNLAAPFYLIQAAIPHLLQTEGAVVNVTSTAAFVGEAYAAAYCATKAGLNHMTKALAMEYMHKPIRFNAVAPGGMMTNIAANLRLPEGADMALIQRFSGLRGLVEVEDVADLVAFLASPAARGYHGACINIDRGITAG
jgi:NAD(P)-dependent dehydrogenase (short-subunit alcohol dehydrogenase family)